MDEYGIQESTNFLSCSSDNQTDRFLKVLIQTHKDLKELRNNVSAQPVSDHSSNFSSEIDQISKVSSQQHEELKVKYNQLILSHEQQKKQYEIRLAEKNEQIEILENFLQSQYLKQILLESNLKHLLKRKVMNASNNSSQISQNMKNSIILGVYNREQAGGFRRKSRDDLRLEDMLKQPSSPRGREDKVVHRQSNAHRVDKLKSSLINLNGLKRHFGNDSKFKQDVLDI